MTSPTIDMSRLPLDVPQSWAIDFLLRNINPDGSLDYHRISKAYKTGNGENKHGPPEAA